MPGPWGTGAGSCLSGSSVLGPVPPGPTQSLPSHPAVRSGEQRPSHGGRGRKRRVPVPAWRLPRVPRPWLWLPRAHTQPMGTQLCWAWPWGAPASTQAPLHSLIHLPVGGTRGWQCGGPSHAPWQRGWALWPLEPACPPHHRLGLPWEGCCPSHTPGGLQRRLSQVSVETRGLVHGEGGGVQTPGRAPGGRSGGSHVPPLLSSPASPIFVASRWPSSQAQSGPGPGSKPREGPSQDSSFC